MPVINGTEFDDVLVGTEDDDVINGLGGDDTIDAGGGNDTIEGGPGNDTINAGVGNDIILYRVADAPGRGDGADAIDGGDGDDLVQIIGVAGAWQSIQLILTTTPTGLSVFRWNSGPNNSTTLANVESVTADFSASPDLYLSYAGSSFDITVNLSMGTATGLASIVGVKNVIAGRANDTIFGDAQSNWLRGEGGDDTLHGGDGNDQLRGDFFPSDVGPGIAGNDALFGGDGDDILWGGAGVDTHDGGEGFDRVSFYDLKATQGAIASLLTQTITNDGFGNAETMVSIEALGSGTAYADWFEGDNNANLLWAGIGDTLLGLGGDDEFYLEGAAALIDGGDGVDTLLSFTGDLNGALIPDTNSDGLAEVIFATHGVNVNLSANAILDDGFGNSGTIVDVENVGGSGFADAIVGNSADNELSGLGGDDSLSGGAGNDSIQGGSGSDAIEGGAGNDAIDAGDGDDVIVYRVAAGDPGRGDGADSVEGGDGNDLVQIIAVPGAFQSIQLILSMGASGLSTVGWHSGPSNMTTLSNVEFVTADFTASPDLQLSYAGNPFDVAVDLTAGAAAGLSSVAGVRNVIGGGGSDTIVGDAQSNFFRGEGGNDTLHGGDGNDHIQGGRGADTLHGGDGNDLLRGEGMAFDVVTPTGDDSLFGGAGDDIMWGGAGVDTYDGGDGADRVSFYDATATQGAVASLLAQTVSNDGFGNAEVLVSVEGLGVGTAYADWFEGDNNANFIWGGIGDTVLALGGDDTFNLQGGPALLDGGAGIDSVLMFTGDQPGTLSPDSNGDGFAELIIATNGVHVNLSQDAIIDDGFGFSGSIINVENVAGSGLNDTLIGDGGANTLTGLVGNDTLSGLGGNDTLNGNDGDDSLDGGAGEDALFGGDGADMLAGEGASDTLDGGAGNDIISGGAGLDTLLGGDGVDTLNGDGGNDTIDGGANDDTISGGAGADTIQGGDGADTLAGDNGSDTITGGAGDDILSGGLQADSFVFASGSGSDTISGFDGNPGGGQDLLDISAFGITAGDFASRVSITDLGADMLVTVDGVEMLLLLGVSGVGQDTITQTDFILGGP